MTPVLKRLLVLGQFAKGNTAPSHYATASNDLRFDGRSPSTAGFSILEIIVIVVIVGFLASIAAPSWLALVDRQRLNASRDEVVQSIRTTQSTAKQRRSSQTLVFADIKFENEGVDPNSIQMTVTDKNNTSIDELKFVQDGTIQTSADSNLTLPFKVVLSPTSSGTKRCIFVDSLLGSIRLEGDDKCS